MGAKVSVAIRAKVPVATNPSNELVGRDHEISHFLDYVYEHSTYYRDLWTDVKSRAPTELEKYPLVDHTSFWAANSFENNTVLTKKQHDGIVMKTGGESFCATYTLHWIH